MRANAHLEIVDYADGAHTAIDTVMCCHVATQQSQRWVRLLEQPRALRGLAKPKAARTLRAGATAEEARAFVRSDAQPKKVLAAKQNQHINGTKEWRERCERQGGAVLQSEVTLSLEEIQALVDELHGTGAIRVTSANPPQVRETITVRGRIIGTWRGLNGDSSPTDCFTVHYSKKGIHVVPSPPSWRKQ